MIAWFLNRYAPYGIDSPVDRLYFLIREHVSFKYEAAQPTVAQVMMDSLESSQFSIILVFHHQVSGKKGKQSYKGKGENTHR